MLRSLVAPDSSASGLCKRRLRPRDSPRPRPPCRFLGAFAALASRPPPSEPLLGAARAGRLQPRPRAGRCLGSCCCCPRSPCPPSGLRRARPAARPAMNAARNAATESSATHGRLHRAGQGITEQGAGTRMSQGPFLPGDRPCYSSSVSAPTGVRGDLVPSPCRLLLTPHPNPQLKTRWAG